MTKTEHTEENKGKLDETERDRDAQTKAYKLKDYETDSQLTQVPQIKIIQVRILKSPERCKRQSRFTADKVAEHLVAAFHTKNFTTK